MSIRIQKPPENGLRADGTKLGGWWHREANSDRIVCDLCPRECSLKPGDRGFCFVRENQAGEMVLTTYGKSTGFCIDPIEKKPLNHFLPGTSVLSFGTAGCNLGCKFCQNWSISKSREVERLSEMATPEAIAAACQEHGCRSVAFTYNDPIIWAEYAIDVAEACRAAGIRTVAVTAGYITEIARRPFFEAIDAANVDLKAFSEGFYQELTLSHIQPVLDTLAWLKRETDIWFEITNLVIPDANDSADEFGRMCEWILENLGDSVPLHFSAFHPDFRLRDRDRTPHETLLRAYQLARRAGIKYVYVGNVNDRTHQSTYCPGCNELLIGRNWYELDTYRLNDNRCQSCDQEIAGVFEATPGDWGRKRQPIRIANYLQELPIVEVPGEIRGSVRLEADLAQPMTDDSETKQGDNVVSPETKPIAEKHADPFGPLDLSEAQRDTIHRSACELVAASVNGYRAEATDATLAAAAGQAVIGCFVTLKNAEKLRACCGFIGKPSTLLAALSHAAITTATNDTRLPTISSIELPFLTLDVTLLHSLKPIEATGADRVQNVSVGTHGLQLVNGNARGLLLPSVAIENKLDAEGFLKQVSMKAGLPPTAWKEDESQLLTFEGTSINGTFPEDVVTRFNVAKPPRFSPQNIQALADFCRHNIRLLASGGTPTFYTQLCPDEKVEGLSISIRLPDKEKPARFGQISLRPGFALQSTALDTCRLAAGVLRAGGYHTSQIDQLEVDVAVLFDPAMHGTVAEPALEAFDPETRALLVSEGNRSAWIVDPEKSETELLQIASEECQCRQPEFARITSLAVVSTETPFMMTSVPQGQAGTPERPPAVAGMFYSPTAEGLKVEVDALFEGIAVAKSACRAALVPHAGLKYSGKLAAQVFSRIEMPPTILVIGPKHTRLGIDWAVAPHNKWLLPGIALGSDQELAQQLVDAIPDLAMDAGAHAKEHAIEVELPLIARVAPDAKVVGVAIGTSDLKRCQEFGEGLASVLQDRPDVLVVISSDMNHFANDDETRRLDEIAIKAAETLNPEELFHRVRDNHISMCGMLPAVMVLDALNRIKPLEKCERVGYATSADVSGDKGRVVGYAGMLFM